MATATTAADYSTAVQQLYVAYFGRPADPLGLYNFQQALLAAKAPTTIEGLSAAYSSSAQVRALVDAFGKSDESAKLYTGSTLEFVNAIYMNVLNRAPDMPGLLFWSNAIDQGGLSKGNAALSIMSAALKLAGDDAKVVSAKIAIASSFTSEVNTVAETLAYAGDAAAATARAMLAKVTKDTVVADFAPTVIETVAAIEKTPVANGQTFTLTTGVDTVVGTSGNDTIVAVIDTTPTPATTTLTSLDSIDGGNGIDVLKINAITDVSVAAGATVTNVESVVINAAAKVGTFAANGTGALDLSGAFASVGEINVKSASEVDFKAGSSTAVNVSGVAGGVEVVGGASQTVSLAAQGGAVKLSGTAGAVNVTSNQGTNSVAIDGGSTVTVNATVSATADAVDGGDITIGATKPATGAVKVVQNLKSNGGDADADDLTAADITVTGGSTVDVTVNAVSTAATETSDGDIAIGAISVTGDGKTTSVSVTQNAAVTEFTKAEVAVVKETSVVTFGAMKSGETLAINGLTFTANKDLTAEQAAAAFANLTRNDTQSASGPTANGIYSGTFNTAIWTSGAVSGKTVTFTAGDHNQTNLAFTGTATTNDAGARIPTQVPTAGKAVEAEVVSSNEVTFGTVTIADDAAAAIKTVTVNGYAAGSTIDGTSVLETLTLANAAGTVDMVVADTAETLTLNVEALGDAVDNAVVTLTAAPKTLNVKSTGDNYVDLVADATEALNVSGTGMFAADGSDLVGLKTVVVTGAAGVSLHADTASTLTSIDTSGTTGAAYVTIDGSKATYVGGAGKDNVTLATAAALTKAINLGAGDDTLSFGTLNVSGSSAALNGGDGVDTLSMQFAAADALDNAAQSFYTGFERLTISNSYTGGTGDTQETLTLNLANLGFTNYVRTSGTLIDASARAAESDILVLDKMASNGTVVLTADGYITVNVADAPTGTADVLNAVVTGGTAATTAGNLTVAKVETINLTSTDTVLDDNGDGEIDAVNDVVEVHTLTLTAADATTVNVTGNAGMTLDMTGSTKATLIDGSTMTAGLTVTSVNTTSATTIKGGSGADFLTAATGTTADVLNGGAGNDTLTANKGMTQMTGGAGKDTFVINVASNNVNSASTITDLSSGDVIKFAGADAFKSAAISLDSTAVFQDFANAAIAAITSDNDLAWFQFGGNTYIVQEKNSGTNADVFVNNEDFIVKITGQVDLSTASFNTAGILEIA